MQWLIKLLRYVKPSSDGDYTISQETLGNPFPTLSEKLTFTSISYFNLRTASNLTMRTKRQTLVVLVRELELVVAQYRRSGELKSPYTLQRDLINNNLNDWLLSESGEVHEDFVKLVERIRRQLNLLDTQFENTDDEHERTLILEYLKDFIADIESTILIRNDYAELTSQQSGPTITAIEEKK